MLQNGQAKLPSATILTFELGAVYDKQKRPTEAEAAFRQVIASDPEHAAALNYLGYMLAERGEKLDESVDLVKRALKIDPENGSYLDSLGWAYYKAGKLDLAAESLKRAADQLTRNSVIQDHYGDVLVETGSLRRGDCRLDAGRSPATATPSNAATSRGRSAPPVRSFRDDDASAGAGARGASHRRPAARAHEAAAGSRYAAPDARAGPRRSHLRVPAR